MIKSVHELARVVSPPQRPTATVESTAKWNDVFAAIGTRLPEDFVQFHKYYGDGYFFSVSHKASANLAPYQQGVSGGAIQRLHELRLLKESRPTRVPCPLYFSPDGLLPWGGTSNEADLCWRVHGELVDNWPVVVLRTAKGEYEEFDCGMAAFLAGVIRGELQCSLLPKNFPGTKGVGWSVWRFPAEESEETYSLGT